MYLSKSTLYKKMMYEARLLSKKGDLVLYVEIRPVVVVVVAVTWICLLARMRTFSHQ